MINMTNQRGVKSDQSPVTGKGMSMRGMIVEVFPIVTAVSKESY